MFKRILVVYDDSPGTRRVLAEAVHLVQQGGAQLTVVAVERHLPRYDGATFGEVRAEHEREQRDCRRWLRAAEAYADEHGVELRTEIRIGRLAQQLARAAVAHRADLLVVGQSGHSHF